MLHGTRVPFYPCIVTFGNPTRWPGARRREFGPKSAGGDAAWRQEEEDAVLRKPSIAVVTVLFLASCSPAPSATPGATGGAGQSGTPPTSGASTAPTRTDLKVGVATDAQSLDPMVDSSGNTQLLLHNIFDTLVVADDS